MWEDPANRVGGKWVLKVPKVLSGHYFEELLLCALGEQFNVGDEITGLVLSVRFAESVLSVWNRNSIMRYAIKSALAFSVFGSST